MVMSRENGWLLMHSGVLFPERGIFLFATTLPGSVLRSTQSPIQLVQEVLSSVLSQPELETVRRSSYIAEIKDVYSFASKPLYFMACYISQVTYY
jgi:hypothetical protein